MKKRAITVIDDKMSLTEHLTELRSRLIKILTILLIGFICCYTFSDKILFWLKQPFSKELIFISPTEAFLSSLKVSFFAGILFSLPFLLFQIWKFISPGLDEHEKKYGLSFVGLGCLLFLIGILFAYYFVLPLGLHFLLSYGYPGLRPMISISSYVSFSLVLLFAFGLVFNMPVVTFFLTKIRLVDSVLLAKNRRYAYIIIFILAAILTPPDVFTQILLGLPLIILYEVSIWISYLFRNP